MYESRMLNSRISKSRMMSDSQILPYKSGPAGQKYDPRDARQLQQQNNYLKILIEQLERHQQQPNQQVHLREQITQQFNRRMSNNQRRLQQLQEIIRDQEQVIQSYEQRFGEFEANLGNLMKLDKDIHAKINSGQSSATLEKNVRNVLVALNSKASYERVIQMIDNIKI